MLMDVCNGYVSATTSHPNWIKNENIIYNGREISECNINLAFKSNKDMDGLLPYLRNTDGSIQNQNAIKSVTDLAYQVKVKTKTVDRIVFGAIKFNPANAELAVFSIEFLELVDNVIAEYGVERLRDRKNIYKVIVKHAWQYESERKKQDARKKDKYDGLLGGLYLQITQGNKKDSFNITCDNEFGQTIYNDQNMSNITRKEFYSLRDKGIIKENIYSTYTGNTKLIADEHFPEQYRIYINFTLNERRYYFSIRPSRTTHENESDYLYHVFNTIEKNRKR